MNKTQVIIRLVTRSYSTEQSRSVMFTWCIEWKRDFDSSIIASQTFDILLVCLRQQQSTLGSNL